MMANYTIVTNTTATCNSIDECVNRMCDLSSNPNVDMICFMPNARNKSPYQQEYTMMILCVLLLCLTLYSIFMTCVALYRWKHDYYQY